MKRDILKKILICGASLVMVASLGSAVNNISAKRIYHHARVARVVHHYHNHKSHKYNRNIPKWLRESLKTSYGSPSKASYKYGFDYKDEVNKYIKGSYMYKLGIKDDLTGNAQPSQEFGKNKAYQRGFISASDGTKSVNKGNINYYLSSLAMGCDWSPAPHGDLLNEYNVAHEYGLSPAESKGVKGWLSNAKLVKVMKKEVYYKINPRKAISAKQAYADDQKARPYKNNLTSNFRGAYDTKEWEGQYPD